MPPVAAASAIFTEDADDTQRTAQPASYTSATTYPLPTSDRLEQVEARLAELERQLEYSGKKPSDADGKIGELDTATNTDNKHVLGSDLTMSASWRHGLELETKTKDFRVHIGGRTQFDGVWLHGGPDASVNLGGVGLDDAVAFRRARLRIDGTLYEFYEWAAEYDFVNSVNLNPNQEQPTQFNVANVPAPTDLWWQVKELPVVGNFRIGNQKEPIGLEHLTSSRWLDFMERSYNQDAFTGAFNNGFTPGLMIFDATENLNATWWLGLFMNNSNPFAFGAGDGEYAADGRLTWTPWYDEASDGRYLLHLGSSLSYRALDEGQILFRARPALRNGPGAINPNLVNTGFFFGDAQTLANVETAAVLGPWLFQAEYCASYVDDAVSAALVPQGTIFYHGYYVEALYFLTGEHRVYDRKNATWNRVVPYENMSLVRTGCGPIFARGAWQLALRFAKLDLRDKGIDGGIVQDVTIGINWFWNPNMKIQFNYDWSHRNAAGGTFNGDINGFGMRLAHDF